MGRNKIRRIEMKKECFFYSHYNLESDENIRCMLFEKTVCREVCERCPFYIQHFKGLNIVKRYVYEREFKTKEAAEE